MNCEPFHVYLSEFRIKAEISASTNIPCSAWMPNTDLTPLETATIDPTDTKGKSKPLAAAYAKAAEENDLQHYKDMLADHQKAVKEEQEAQAERDAKKSAKAKRKSVDASATPAVDDDEMDIDDEEEEPKPKSKKRKKGVESDVEEKVIAPGFPCRCELTGHYSLRRPRRPLPNSSYPRPRLPLKPRARKRPRNPSHPPRRLRKRATTKPWRLPK